MKINWAEYQVGTELKMISHGGCFIYDHVLYIKTNIEEQQLNNDFIKIMAVDLENGIAEYFFRDTIVIPIDAEINANDN